METRNENPTSKRRPVNLTIRTDLIDAARAMGLNASRAAERGIQSAIVDEDIRVWRERNHTAILAHNERVGQHGTLLKPYWLER